MKPKTKKKIIIWIAILLCVAAFTAVLCLCTVLHADISGEGGSTSEDGSEDIISVVGPKIILRITALKDSFMGLFANPITQTTVSLFLVTVILLVIALLVNRAVKKSTTRKPSKFLIVVEKLVTMLRNIVRDTMGEHNLKFLPYIGTIFLCSICGTVIGMTQVFRSTTADLSVTVAWALVTTGLVWYNNIKYSGFLSWLKGFTEPVVVMTPMNIVSEVANPISMAFRHFGNVAGGGVLTALIYGALASLSTMVFGWVPEAIAAIFPPVFQVGIPAVLSIYFDLFSGFVQAFVFSLLTMVYVGGACPPPEELMAARAEKEEKRAAKAARRAEKKAAK